MLKRMFRMLLKFCKKHSTKILAGSALVSEIIGFYFMHKRAPIARKKLDELPPDAGLLDKIKVAGPIYLPAGIMLAISGACIVGGCAVGEAKLTAMTNIAMASDAALHRYEQKMIETMGPENAQKVHEEIAKDIMAERPIASQEIIPTTHGVDLFFDPLSGRYFQSSANFIQKAVAKMNNDLSSPEMWVTVNDWYYELGLPHAKLAGLCGWNVDHPLKVEIDWYSHDDGRPCGNLIYFEAPRLYDDENLNSKSCDRIW